MPPPSNIPCLQLPTISPLEPLTNGTNLPPVPLEESPRPTNSVAAGKYPSSSANNGATTETTPPQSPDRPTSMRRFLSRVSLNSSYNEDDKASIMTTPMSPTSSVMSVPDGKRKKSSWWKKSKPSPSSSAAQPPASVHTLQEPSGASSAASTRNRTAQRPPVHSIAPPPKLPDDLFGSGFSSLDSDMFKNFK